MPTRREFLCASAAAGLAAGLATWTVTALKRPWQSEDEGAGRALLLRSAATEATQFAAGLAAAGLGLVERQLHAGEPSFKHLDALLNLDPGTRLFALVDDRDAMLIEAILGRRIRAQWHRAHHAAGSGASRHVIQGAGFMQEVGAMLAARLQAGRDSYLVGTAIRVATLTADLQAQVVQPWPYELGRLLGRAGQAQPAAGSAITPALQRGVSISADRRFVSLVVDV